MVDDVDDDMVDDVDNDTDEWNNEEWRDLPNRMQV